MTADERAKVWKEWNLANAAAANGDLTAAIDRLLGIVADLIEDARRD